MVVAIIPRSLSQEDAVRCPRCGDAVYLSEGCCMDVDCATHVYLQDQCFKCRPEFAAMLDDWTVEYQVKLFNQLPKSWLECPLGDVCSLHRLHWYRAKYPVVAKAYRVAQEAHAGQRRRFGGKPFFSHLERVAWRVACSSTYDMRGSEGTRPWELLVAAALLHDVLEDTPCTREQLAEQFPAFVVTLVKELTNVKVAGLTRAQQKAADHARLKDVSENAKLLKLADRIDNLLELEEAPADFRTKYHLETTHLLEAMGETSHLLEALMTVIETIINNPDEYFASEGSGPSSQPLD